MPFKYIIKWRRTHPEKVSVEAYHKYPQTEQEKHKPAFIIGKAEGGGVLVIRHILEKTVKSNPTRKYGNTLHILFDQNNETTYETAYRIGLAAALINKAETTQEVQNGAKYILNATPEEIWFWTSKLLDDEVSTRALKALAVLSGSTQIDATTPPRKTKQKIPESRINTFWSLVRRQMREKAKQLYIKDHPEIKTPPELSELQESGYLETAKEIVFKEMTQEPKAS